MNQTKTLYILDINALFFRSYYAISLNMKSDKGLPTNALYGVLKMVQQLGRKKSPDYLVACFDTKEPSFRKQLYSEYKANRTEMPEDLAAQAPYLKKMMDRLKIPFWEAPGFEADDLIASLTFCAQKENLEVYIVSGDKDFAQLVKKGTYLYDTMKEILYDPEKVEQKWGVPPSQIKDYLSLVGDSSDNVPGVKGIGPKGAVQLLKTYPSLEEIYKRLEDIKGSLRAKLEKDKEMAFLSKKLVTLREDVSWSKNLLETNYKTFSNFSKEEKQALKSFLEELSFKSFIKTFFPVKTESPKPIKDSWEESKKTLQKPSAGKQKAFPISKIKTLSLEEFKKALPPYAQIWIGCYKDQFYLSHEKSCTLLFKEDLKKLQSFLDYKWVRYSGHDLKFFWKILEIEHSIAEWDSLIVGHLLTSKASPSFKSLCKAHLNSSEEEEWSLPQTLYQEKKLKEELLSQLKAQELELVFQDIELPLIAVLYRMERQGIKIDLQEIERQSSNLEQDIKNLEFQIHKLAGEEFNLSSPKQLAVILFEKLKLPVGRKTKRGWSTDSFELMKIKKLHPILPLLLEYRELFKLKSAYMDSFLSLRDKKTGRIYTEFKQTVTSTGRLSSVNPNLQNIPIRTERGRLIRKAFVSSEGKQLICADYSQVELRILAHITGDPNLKKAFEQDLDIHSSTASEIFNVPLKEVSSDLRRKSKAVNFGIAYGQGVYGLSESLSIPRSEAKEIINSYFKKFKKIKDYIESIKEELPQTHYVKTLYGRKRFFDPYELKHPKLKAGAERAAINAPLQGTASDLIKKAMIQLDKSLPIPILSQVHDELLFECPLESSQRELEEIRSLMEINEVLQVPLKVNLSVGKNWFIAH